MTATATSPAGILKDGYKARVREIYATFGIPVPEED